MAFGVSSFIGLHYSVWSIRTLFSTLLLFFLPYRSLTGVEMRRKTLTDFSISSERKLEHRGGRAWWEWTKSHIFQEFSYVFFFFFHGRMVVLIFQLPDWGIMVLDCIRVSTQLPLRKWYLSPKQWILLELKPISVLKWGLSVLCGICAIPEHLIMVLPPSKRENDTRPV